MESLVFLGVKELPLMQEALSKKSPQLLALFIQDHPDYLQRVYYDGQAYLGKFLGSHVDLSCLDLIEKNIHSLLRRLDSDYPFHEAHLELFPIIQTP